MQWGGGGGGGAPPPREKEKEVLLEEDRGAQSSGGRMLWGRASRRAPNSARCLLSVYGVQSTVVMPVVFGALGWNRSSSPSPSDPRSTPQFTDVAGTKPGTQA